MKLRNWKSTKRAASLIVAAALACHMVASVGAHTTRSARVARPCVLETVVRGRGRDS